MHHKLFALSFGFAALILVVQAGHAAPQCAERAAVLDQLANRFGEERHAIGLSADNLVMELFASVESQSWSITVTSPQGITCLISSGHGFEPVAELRRGRGDPA